MLCFGILAVSVALAAAAPQPVSHVLELDLSPEEAQKYLSSPPYTEPQLVSRTAVLPLIKYNDPRFRTAEAGPTLGHYWKNGHEIENTDDYVEEVYNANQFHGQDGLGAYGYGYETPESAKVENRVRSGDVSGSYTYKAGNNELIKVRYWADSQGFHQEDNIPKVVLKPVEEAEDVRQARLAHEKAWQEAAALSRQQPDPQGEYYNKYDYQPASSEQQNTYLSAANQGNQARYQPPASAQQNAFVAANQDSQAREAKAYYGNQGSYQTGQQAYPTPVPTKYEEPEPTGPPRGFFYAFDYPVSIIVAKSSLQGGEFNPGYPVDQDTVALGQQRG